MDVGGVVAGPTLQDWAAVGPTGSAGPVQSRLQLGVLGVVLRHAPQLHGNDAVPGHGGQDQVTEGE